MTRVWRAAMAFALTGGMAASALAEGSKPVPYWASITKSEARMRVGPSLDYPSSWVYRRADLPVKVVQVHGNWRKIEDSRGTQGWMHVRLLSDTATAIVTGGEPVPLRRAPEETAAVAYRAEPGVVGRIGDCAGGWCLLDVAGQKGFVRADRLWGGVK